MRAIVAWRLTACLSQRARVSEALEAELAHGEPGPELITAAMAYLRGGTCLQLHDVADVVLRSVPPPALAAPAARIAALSGGTSTVAATADATHRRLLSRDASQTR